MVAARKLEMEYALKKRAWKTNPRHVVKKSGWEIIKFRWIDINTGDDHNPNYMSRMVGEELNDRVLEGLFAATPPLEALRLLPSWAATRTDDGQLSVVGAGKSIMIADVSRAFFEAPARRDICVELSAEALSKDETPEHTLWESRLAACTQPEMRQPIGRKRLPSA